MRLILQNILMICGFIGKPHKNTQFSDITARFLLLLRFNLQFPVYLQNQSNNLHKILQKCSYNGNLQIFTQKGLNECELKRKLTVNF